MVADLQSEIKDKLDKDYNFWEYLNLTYSISIGVLIKHFVNQPVNTEEYLILTKFCKLFYNSGLIQRLPKCFLKANTIFAVYSIINSDFTYTYPMNSESFVLNRVELDELQQLQYSLLQTLNEKPCVFVDPVSIYHEHIISCKDASSLGIESFVISLINSLVKIKVSNGRLDGRVETVGMFALLSKKYRFFFYLSFLNRNLESIAQSTNLDYSTLDVVSLISLNTLINK